MTTAQAAFHWWNAATGNEEDLDFVPICPYPREVIPIWRKYFIEFIYEIDAYQLKTPHEYWRAISNVLKKYYQEGDIPDPISDFASFVNILYLLKYTLMPQDVISVINLINGYQRSKRNIFFVLTAPIIIEDPLLYLNAIDYMRESNAKFWVDFSKNKDYNDFFIGFYLSLLLPTKSKEEKVWEYRLLLVRILYNQILILPRSHENFLDYCLTLLERITDCAKNCTDEASINLVRYFISTVKLIGKKCQLDTMRSHVNGLYEALPPDAAGFHYIYQYSQTMFGRSQHMTGPKLLLCIKKRKHDSPRDFLLMANLINKSQNASVLTLIAKTALSASYWFRTGMKMILDIASLPKRSADIDEWLSVFFRRLLVFVILSSTTGRYVGRAMMICEFLAQVQESEVSKDLKMTIKRGAASVLEHPSCPPYFSFFVNCSQKSDTKTTQEINDFLKSNLSNILKSFPFMKTRPLFVVPAGKKNDNLSFLSAPAKVKGSKNAKKSPASKSKALKPYTPNAKPDINTQEDSKLLKMINDRSPSPLKPKPRNTSEKTVTLQKTITSDKNSNSNKFSISFSVRSLDFGVPGNIGLLESGHLARSDVYFNPPPIAKVLPKRKKTSSVGFDREKMMAQRRAEIEIKKALEAQSLSPESIIPKPIRAKRSIPPKQEEKKHRSRHKSNTNPDVDENNNLSSSKRSNTTQKDVPIVAEEKEEKHRRRRHRTESKQDPNPEDVREKKRRRHRHRSAVNDDHSLENSEKPQYLQKSSSAVQYQASTLPSILQQLVPDSPLHTPRSYVPKQPVQQVPAPKFTPGQQLDQMPKSLVTSRTRIVSADVETLVPSTMFTPAGRRTEELVRTYRDKYLAEEEIHPIAKAIPMTFHLRTSTPSVPRRVSRSESDSDGSNIMMGRLIADGALE